MLTPVLATGTRSVLLPMPLSCVPWPHLYMHVATPLARAGGEEGSIQGELWTHTNNAAAGWRGENWTHTHTHTLAMQLFARGDSAHSMENWTHTH